MGFQLQNISCIRGSRNEDPSSSMQSPKMERKFKSDGSLTSQGSSLNSQSSFENPNSSRSMVSLQSEFSIHSQTSIQSQQSLCSQSSLASIPSIPRSAKCGGVSVYPSMPALKGHIGCVYSLAMAGNLLYSGSSGNDIRVWRHPEMKEYSRFGHGEGAVKSILVSGDRVYSAHQDHRIRVWRRSGNEPAVHRLIATIPTVKDFLITMILPKNSIQVRRHRKCLWIEHVDTISALAVDKNGFLYSASWDRTVKVWRPSDLRCVESFRAHDDAVNALLVSAGGFLYTGSADFRIKAWARPAGEKRHSLVATMERHKSAVNALALNPDGSVLYSGACDRSIIVWQREASAQHMTVSGALRGHKLAILCLATVSDLLCSGSADKTIRIWRKGDGNLHSCLAVLEGHRGAVKSIAVSLDTVHAGSYLVHSGGLDHDVRVWRVTDDSRGASEEEADGSPLKTLEVLNCKV